MIGILWLCLTLLLPRINASTSLSSALQIIKMSAGLLNQIDRKQQETNENTDNDKENILPFITIAYAQTLDGSIAPLDKRRLNISSSGAFRLLHSLRSQHDAVLVGINTILIDKPRLNVRDPLHEHENNNENTIIHPCPRAIVLDSHLKLSSMNIQDDLKVYKPIICTCVSETSEAFLVLQEKLKIIDGILLHCQSDIHGKVDIPSCLHALKTKLKIHSILVEGGAHILQSFFELSIVNQVLVSVQPTFLGGYRSMVRELKNPLSLVDVHIGTIEGNILIYGVIKAKNEHKDSNSIEESFDRSTLTILPHEQRQRNTDL